MPFAYLRDPLFRLCFASYFLNRWALRPWCDWTLLHA
jgi:hypothetical protein